MAKIIVAKMRDLLSQYNKGDISFSRMCELINEEAVRTEPKLKRKRIYYPKVKICAACGSFTHGNPGHDI